MADYPQRDGTHFAHKVVRRMIHVCAAQEIGSDAFMLVTTIAHTEDAKRYTGPVTWWNDQLQSVLGFGSWNKLDRARKRAVDAGWLCYKPGGKGKVGKYWVAIPKRYEDIPDAAVDASTPIILHAGVGTTGEEAQLSSTPACEEAGDKRGTSGGQAGDKRGTTGDPSTLTLTLNPNPKPASSWASAAAADRLTEKARELLCLWNATPGIKPARSMGPSRVGSLNARMTEDARWWDSLPIALKRIGQSSFCRGGGSRGWIANLKWLLRPETMTKILEGEYDDEAPGTAGESPPRLSYKLPGDEEGEE